MLPPPRRLVALFAAGSTAQSIADYGSSGGSGPKGGIGDLTRPVLVAQAYITDGKIASSHPDQELRQLASSTPPALDDPNRNSCNREFVFCF